MLWGTELGEIGTELFRSAPAAAWAQTVAVGFGLFIAIWVPLRQRRDELRDRTQQQINEATGLALLLIPYLERYCADLQRTIVQAETISPNRRPLFAPALAESQAMLLHAIDNAVSLFPAVVDRLEHLHRLGPLAQPIHELVHLSRAVTRGFRLLDDAHQPLDVLPFDIPVVHSAIQSAKVLKAHAFSTRRKFESFLDIHLGGSFKTHVKRASRFEW